MSDHPLQFPLILAPASAIRMSAGQQVLDLRTIFTTPAGALAIGDGTASPTFALSKAGAGTADVLLDSAGVMRARVRLDASENLVISTHNSDGDMLGSITVDGTTGAITMSGRVRLGLTDYADNAAALADGLQEGDTYRVGADVKIVLAP